MLNFLRVEGKWLLLPLLMVLLMHYVGQDITAQPPDDEVIVDAATALAAGQVFSSCKLRYFPLCQEGDPTAAREPLPIILFAVQKILQERIGLSIVVINAILNVCTGIVIYVIALRLFTDRRVGVLSVLMWAIYWPLLRTVAFVRSESLFSLLLAVAMLALITALKNQRSWQFVLVGACLGLALLTRSTLLYSTFFIPVGFFFLNGRRWRQAIKAAVLILVPMFLVLLPWLVRNYQVFDRVVIGSTLNGYNLYRHNHVVTDDNFIQYGDAWVVRDNILAELDAHPELSDGGLNEVEMNALYIDMAVDAIKAHPFRYMGLAATRFLLFQWFDFKVADYYGYQNSGYQLYLVISTLVLFLGGVWGAVRFPTQRWPFAWPLVAIIVYLSLLHPLVVTMSRYMIPVMPYIFMFAAYWLTLFFAEQSRAQLKTDFAWLMRIMPIVLIIMAVIGLIVFAGNTYYQRQKLAALTVTPLPETDAAPYLTIANSANILPCAVFDVGEHGFRIAQLKDYPHCSGQDFAIYCLDGEGQWSDENISNLTIPPDAAQIQFISGQHGVCGIFVPGPAG